MFKTGGSRLYYSFQQTHTFKRVSKTGGSRLYHIRSLKDDSVYAFYRAKGERGREGWGERGRESDWREGWEGGVGERGRERGVRERGERGVRVLDDTLHFQCRPITVHTSINPFIERALS